MQSNSAVVMMLVISAIFLFFLRPISAVHSRLGPTTNEINFIRRSCNATLYPEVCYTSLATYASAVQADPARLARLAIGVTLSQTTATAAYISRLSHSAEYGADHRATAAVHDCLTNLGDAVDEMRGSLRQMRGIRRHFLGSSGSGSAESFRFQVSNVQTWMSAALTDEDTCTDGFDDVVDGEVKTLVSEKVADVKMYTSNALALVNSYAEKETP